MLNQNEKCLLKYISDPNSCFGENGILNTIKDLGIKIKFCDLNPVYQIIDEMNFSVFKQDKIKSGSEDER